MFSAGIEASKLCKEGTPGISGPCSEGLEKSSGASVRTDVDRTTGVTAALDRALGGDVW